MNIKLGQEKVFERFIFSLFLILCFFCIAVAHQRHECSSFQTWPSVFHTCPLLLGDLCLLKVETLNRSSYSGVCSMRQAWCSSCSVWLITCALSGCRSFLSPSPSLPTVHYSENEREREICLSVCLMLCWVYIWLSLCLSLFPLVMRYDRGVSVLLRPCVLCCVLWEQHAQHTHNESLHTIRHAVWHTYSLHTHTHSKNKKCNAGFL